MVKYLSFGILAIIIIAVLISISYWKITESKQNKQSNVQIENSKTQTTEVIQPYVEENKPIVEEITVEQSYYVAASRVHFFKDESTQLNAYLTEGEVALIRKIRNGFGYTVFTNSRGQRTEGWLIMNELRENNLAGEWAEADDEISFGFRFNNDGTFSYSNIDCTVTGRYIIKNNSIALTGKSVRRGGYGGDKTSEFNESVELEDGKPIGCYKITKEAYDNLLKKWESAYKQQEIDRRIETEKTDSFKEASKNAWEIYELSQKTTNANIYAKTLQSALEACNRALKLKPDDIELKKLKEKIESQLLTIQNK
jgi:hypothetical protein